MSVILEWIAAVRQRLCRHRWSEWRAGIDPDMKALLASDATGTMEGLYLLAALDVDVVPPEDKIVHRECRKCLSVEHAVLS